VLQSKRGRHLKAGLMFSGDLKIRGQLGSLK